MDVSGVPSLERVSAERRRLKMAASRLEADILQTIIRHAQDNHTPTEVILLALINCTAHWQNHVVNTNVTKTLHKELDGS